MRINLSINGKNIRFFINAGWYKGEEFYLFKLELFNIAESHDAVYLINLQIAKLLFSLGANWEKEE